jgi:hypothetical protein
LVIVATRENTKCTVAGIFRGNILTHTVLWTELSYLQVPGHHLNMQFPVTAPTQHYNMEFTIEKHGSEITFGVRRRGENCGGQQKASARNSTELQGIMFRS